MSASHPPLFHAGELAVQERAGVREQVASFAPRMIRASMPEQHRTFFESLPFLVVGGLTEEGAPVASVVAGPPGFVTAADPVRLRIRALPRAGDPLWRTLRVGAPVGLLGIEFTTRRRNRANGTILALEQDSWVVSVQQSFGNCPQYIQARELLESVPQASTELPRESPQLSARALGLIARADTFFLASAAASGTAGSESSVSESPGVDVSHRGGPPGFVERSADGSILTVPDYSGNNLFMTLGNLAQNPRAGLTFVNFDDGSLLSLTATCEIVWRAAPETLAEPAAERLLRFHVESAEWVANALPYRWSAPAFAREFSGRGGGVCSR